MHECACVCVCVHFCVCMQLRMYLMQHDAIGAGKHRPQLPCNGKGCMPSQATWLIVGALHGHHCFEGILVCCSLCNKHAFPQGDKNQHVNMVTNDVGQNQRVKFHVILDDTRWAKAKQCWWQPKRNKHKHTVRFSMTGTKSNTNQRQNGLRRICKCSTHALYSLANWLNLHPKINIIYRGLSIGTPKMAIYNTTIHRVITPVTDKSILLLGACS